jgi:zinc protease
MTARAQLAVMALAIAVSCAASPPRTQPALGAGAADEEAFRAHPPAPEPALRFKAHELYVTTLPNGMRLVVFERHTLRVVAAELVVRGGTSILSHGSPAAARLMEGTVMAGTQRQSELQLYQDMNVNVLALHPRVHRSWTSITLRGPSMKFDRALTLLHDVALEPTFPPYAIDVARRRLIGNETTFVDQPWSAAERNLSAALYGLRHPYTVALASPGRELEGLTRDEVANGWRDMMDPADATLVVAGDVDPLVVRQSVATLFGGWAHDAARRPAVPVPTPEPAASSARIVVVDRPGARQATIFYGARGPDDSIAHKTARFLVDDLVDQVEARSASSAAGGEPGATWSAERLDPVMFWWEQSVAPDRVRSSLRELDGWLGSLRERGPDADDLKMARTRVIRRVPRAFETVEKAADSFGGIVSADAPLDWMDKLQANAATLPWEEIRGALPPPEQMRVVVVGNLAAVMDQLLSLGWGPVEVRDVDGHLLRTVAPGG